MLGGATLVEGLLRSGSDSSGKGHQTRRLTKRKKVSEPSQPIKNAEIGVFGVVDDRLCGQFKSGVRACLVDQSAENRIIRDSVRTFVCGEKHLATFARTCANSGRPDGLRRAHDIPRQRCNRDRHVRQRFERCRLGDDGIGILRIAASLTAVVYPLTCACAALVAPICAEATQRGRYSLLCGRGSQGRE